MDKSIGKELREARREKGMGLPEVSSVLCISKTYLRGLEEANEEQLPDAAFAIGFLRTYAEYLGLNADDLVARAKQQPKEISDEAAGSEISNTAEKPADNTSGDAGAKVLAKSHDSSMPAVPLVMIVMAGVLSLAVAIGMYEPGAPSTANAETSPLQSSSPIEIRESVPAAAEPAQEDAISDRAAPTKALGQAPIQALGQVKVEIVAADDAWISLRDAEDQPLYREVLTKGERYSFPVNGAVRLATGHPDNIQVFVDGRQLQPPPHQGSVVRDWRIDAASDDGAINHGEENTSE